MAGFPTKGRNVDTDRGHKENSAWRFEENWHKLQTTRNLKREEAGGTHAPREPAEGLPLRPVRQCTFCGLSHWVYSALWQQPSEANAPSTPIRLSQISQYCSWDHKKKNTFISTPVRTDAFELWCWRRLLRVPWTARRSHQSILKEINPEYSLEWLMLKLKLQSFGHLMPRADSLEKILMLGKTEGRRRRGWLRMRSLESLTNSMDMSLSKLREILKDRGDWRAAVHGGHKDSDTTEAT